MIVTKSDTKFRKDKFSRDNSGFASVPSCVTRCLFLSDMAKTLYTDLIQHAYGEKRYSYPSQARLAQDLQTTTKRIGKYSDELEFGGLIKRTMQAVNYMYTFPDVNYAPNIVHSEVVWKVYEKVKDYKISYNKFTKAVKVYKKSCLFQEASASIAPEEYADSIEKFFFNELSIKTEDDDWANSDKLFIVKLAEEDNFRIRSLEYLNKKHIAVYGESLVVSSKDNDYMETVYDFTHIPLEQRLYCIFDSDICNKRMEIVNKAIDEYYSNNNNEHTTVKKFAEYYLKSICGEHEFMKYINGI